MNNQFVKKEEVPHLVNWQIAYLARELRHKKSVTLICLKNETDFLLSQLRSFSNSTPIKMKTFNKPNSKEVFVEIADVV